MTSNFNSKNMWPKLIKLIKNPVLAMDNLRVMEIEMCVYKEIFIEEPYNWLYKNILPETTVIDIGSCFGESCVYFARNPNTKRVVGIEAEKRHFDIGVNNIKSSLYRKKIKLINKKLTTFNDLDYDNKENIVIKCDIEGGEEQLFDTFISSLFFMKNVHAIQIEFHSTLILNKLIKLFKNLQYDINFIYTDKKQDIGYFYARNNKDNKK